MTLENAQRLLKHYNDLADGTIPKPVGHKDWDDVVYNAKLRAAATEKIIEKRMKHQKYAHLLVEEKPKREVKKSGSLSNRKQG